MDAATLTNESRFNGLFVGASGSGKKAAACTFPHPIKYYDMDGRIRGLLGSPWVERSGIDWKYYPPIMKEGLVYKVLNDDLEVLEMQATMGKIPYKTIYMGSLTGEAFALLRDAVALTHDPGSKDSKKTGKYIGSLAMADPGDYNYVYTGIRNILAFFRSLPGVNIIIGAHTIPRFAKPMNPDGTINTYADNIQVGSKLSLPDKIGAEVPSGFDNVFEFSKRFDGLNEKFYVQFRSDIARTTYPQLKPGLHDITNTNFYEYLQKQLGTQAAAEAIAK
jgi:hypothetical protein